jgi:hypothetical protein
MSLGVVQVVRERCSTYALRTHLLFIQRELHRWTLHLPSSKRCTKFLKRQKDQLEEDLNNLFLSSSEEKEVLWARVRKYYRSSFYGDQYITVFYRLRVRVEKLRKFSRIPLVGGEKLQN